MNKVILSATAILALSSGLATAADQMVGKAPPPTAAAAPASVWDIAFGGAIMSDYNFRGISQSDRGPALTAYFEPRLKLNPNFELYAGIQGWSTKLPTDPTGEFDLYAGVRPTFGPLNFDFGFLYYWYPKERQVFLDDNPFSAFPGGAVFFPTTLPWTLADTDFWEVYGKVSYTWNDVVTIGAQVWYSPDWLNTGADGLYAQGNFKVNLPSSWLPKDWGWYVSGEIAHYWLGTTGPFFLFIDLPDYWYGNIGFGITYKVFTLDFRFHDTDLSKTECFVLTGDLAGLPGGGGPLGRSNWCGQQFIVKGSFDLTWMTNLK
jgi:Bacterial protein of unknown function (Gcw_chp)